MNQIQPHSQAQLPGARPTRANRRRHFSHSGAALVITLAVLGIVVLLVVGFSISMRVEQIAARNFTSVNTARQLAKAGLEEAIFLIRTNTPAITSSANSYVTMPGVVIPHTAGASPQKELFSTNAIANAGSVNLNSRQSVIGSNANYSTVDSRQIYANWVNVCTNGAASGAPLTGRYAFWVDDEATKININAACARTDNLGATMRNVDLTALGITGGTATNSWNFGNTTGFFTVEHWKSVSGIGATTFSQNRSYVTVYSKDPDLTPWGTKKISLNAGNSVAAISNQLSNAALNNWFGKTFADKYGTALLNQIAANIIDFHTAGDDSTTDSQTAPTYCGLKATPYLNEVIVKGSVNPATSNATITAEFELVFPYATGTGKGNGYTIAADYTITDGSGLLPGMPVTNSLTVAVTNNVPDRGYSSPLSTMTLYTTNDIALASVASSPLIRVVFSKLRLLNTTGKLVNYALDLTNPPPWAASTTLSVPFDGTTAASSIGANDPRANHQMEMVDPLDGTTVLRLWDKQNSAAGTPGVQNSNFSISVGATTDLTDDGNENNTATQVNHSNYYIKNADYESVGELGYIHTGRPWRSLRLQPRAAGSHIPDWAVLDLFSVTNQPLAGRININPVINSLTNINPRIDPLRAVTTAITSDADVVATNICNQIWASTSEWSTNRTTSPYTFNSYAFNMIGELCEIDRVAANYSGATNDAMREARIRSFANLVTVRSDTFTVWAVGQAIKDVNANGVYDAGTDLILGEARVQAVIERYDAADGQFGVGTDTPAYRVVYFRYLTQ